MKRRLICLMLLSMAAPARAQSQVRHFQFTIPYDISRLDPAVKQIMGVCRVGERRATGFRARLFGSASGADYVTKLQWWSSPRLTLSDLSMNGTGGYSGSLEVRFDANVDPVWKGTTDDWECGIAGCAPSLYFSSDAEPARDCDFLSANSSTPMLRIAKPVSTGEPPLVKGKLTY